MDKLMKQSFDEESIHRNRISLQRKRNILCEGEKPNHHVLFLSEDIASDEYEDDCDFQHSDHNMNHTDHNYHK